MDEEGTAAGSVFERRGRQTGFGQFRWDSRVRWPLTMQYTWFAARWAIFTCDAEISLKGTYRQRKFFVARRPFPFPFPDDRDLDS